MLGWFGKLTVKEHVCPTRSGTSPERRHQFTERFQTIGWNLARLFAQDEWSAPEDRAQIKNIQVAIRSVLETLSREGGIYYEGASIDTRYAERKVASFISITIAAVSN
jgi:hypothetical protein